MRALLIPALFVTACGTQIQPSDLHSDSGVTRPPYAQIINQLNSVATANSAWAKTFSIGPTTNQNPTMAIEIKNPDVQIVGPTIFIMEAIHGNEYEHVADRLPSYFLSLRSDPLYATFFARGGSFHIVPVANPDGYISGVRQGAGIDLNRDFPNTATGAVGFKSNETKNLHQYLSSIAKSRDKSALGKPAIDIAFSYHCCQNNAALIPWGYADVRWDQQMKALFEPIMTLVPKVFPHARIGTPPQILYAANGTELDYFYQNYKSRSIVWEAEGFGAAENQFGGHKALWNALISLVLKD